jgi:hypothetical protein
MVRTFKEEQVDREDLLYDPVTLERLFEEYGPATEIKRHVKTRATVYEIRAATWYWVQDKGCPRSTRGSNAAQHVWKTAKAIDNGRAEGPVPMTEEA